jgi:hypothetical protein
MGISLIQDAYKARDISLDQLRYQVGSHLLGGVGVGVLHEGLEALALLKGGNLLHQAERAEDQVQRVQRDRQVRLRPNRQAGSQSGLIQPCTQDALSKHL